MDGEAATRRSCLWSSLTIPSFMGDAHDVCARGELQVHSAPMTSRIIWTEIDEAPALATYSLLPLVRAFLKDTGIGVEAWDISLAGRILANFPEKLTAEQRVPDYLARLGELAQL